MAFEPASALIGLREGMEIFLVVGILLGILRRLGHGDRASVVWIGFAAGAATAAVVGVLLVNTVAEWFEASGGAMLFEVIVALAAVAVLTWMVLWMQRHAKTMVSDLKARTEAAATSGKWFAIGFLAYVTVIREGLEIVLFYSALAAQSDWGSILLSGLVGFAVSGVLALLVFRFMVKVDVRRFFAVSGLFLILIAAGLLVHVVHALSDLGWLPHAAPLWDTSATLPDEDHWLGGPLHAFMGYEDRPTALQLLLYLGYILGVGGWYLTRLSADDRQKRTGTTAAILFVLLLALFAIGGAVSTATDDHEEATGAHDALDHKALTAGGVAALEPYDGKVGILIRQHGEWVHYNASTYESVKAFVDGIWPYTGLPPELLKVDEGTYFIDDAHPWSDEVHIDTELVDAWLSSWSLPATPVKDPLGVSEVDELAGKGGFYFAPGQGPGMGEGDMYEIFGLSAYRTWLQMENHSPMYDAVKTSWALLEEHMTRHYGDKVVPAFAFHVDPKMDPSETTEAAAQKLADADVDLVIDVYQSSVHSDSMDTCMMRPHTEHALRAAGYDGPIVHMDRPAGLHPAWGATVARYLKEQAERLPDDAQYSVQLTQHGARPGGQNPCGEGPDKYHRLTQEEFAVSYTAVRDALGPDVAIRHVYGQGADARDDGVLSPVEALELDRQQGYTHSLILPYEFWGNAMDNLVYLRGSLGCAPETAPCYDADYETNGTHEGVAYTVLSATYGTEGKITALLAQIDRTLAEALGGEPVETENDGAHH
ncbi:MAG: FTR1 family protein [Euryarchaeota archaeon]|nr:FTR1 family protein [Euryarchaeota archaeon]